MACESITRHWLARHPLPPADPHGDKESRGCVLVVAGSDEMPGAAMLAALATLRAGAGKVTVVSARGAATALAIALPEARVDAADTGAAGALRLDGLPALADDRLAGVAAVLVGPGMHDAAAGARIVCAAVARCGAIPTVLDASAMDAAPAGGLPVHTLLTPHAGELAHLTGGTKDAVLADPAAAASAAAAAWGVHVLLKGATTVLAGPAGALWRHHSRHAGLGTSGSGDVLAGAIAGIAAQGVALPVAAAWGVALHARCAARLERRHADVGYLARELVDEIPRALRDLRAR